jgi:molybdopterin-guanine dinucleotide biosynthesis protein A
VGYTELRTRPLCCDWMREHTLISPEEITVLILAGGRGSRMGGRDKGLISIRGKPALDHLLARIGLQSRHILISANRNFEHYARYGYPVVRDTVAGFAGPLAGVLAGFSASSSAFLLTLPVDAPLVSPDYLERMTRCLQQSDKPACVAECQGQLEPVFCLAEHGTARALESYLAAGHRSVQGWLERIGATRADFSDVPQQFINLNRAGDQRRLEALLGG